MDGQDLKYLERALQLADRGLGRTSPNPIVGAVIVKQNSVLGEGWHAGAGLDHAEVSAIRDALRRAGMSGGSTGEPLEPESARSVCAGATMYVSLEPCCTQGRTPPCTTALIEAGFARVVAATLDPSALVNGKGLQILRAAGISVEVADGPLELRAKRQNDGVRKSVVRGLPFVEYKFALTLDGRVATDSGDSRWISSPESRALVHVWRSRADAVVVGGGTVAADDPLLTAREVECWRQPLRVVVDSDCTLAKGSNLARTAGDSPVLMVCSKGVERDRLAEIEAWGVATAVIPSDEAGSLDPQEVGRILAARGVQSVLLEGGPRLAGAWWAAGMVDKVAAFVCPRVVGGVKAAGPMCVPGAVTMREASDLREVEVAMVGADVLITGYTGEPF